MGKIAIVYWSGTGNTEAMANLVAEGVRTEGDTADLFEAASFSANDAKEYDAIGFGCPSMGAEELEDSEFQPMFDSVKPQLGEKGIVLFGSYDWGDGEWMRNWEEECRNEGFLLLADSVITQDAPDSDSEARCIALGAALAKHAGR